MSTSNQYTPKQLKLKQLHMVLYHIKSYVKFTLWQEHGDSEEMPHSFSLLILDLCVSNTACRQGKVMTMTIKYHKCSFTSIISSFYILLLLTAVFHFQNQLGDISLLFVRAQRQSDDLCHSPKLLQATCYSHSPL